MLWSVSGSAFSFFWYFSVRIHIVCPLTSNDQMHIFMPGDSRVNPRKAIYILFPSITCVHKLNNSFSGIEIVAKNGTLRKTDTRIEEN